MALALAVAVAMMQPQTCLPVSCLLLFCSVLSAGEDQTLTRWLEGSLLPHFIILSHKSLTYLTPSFVYTALDKLTRTITCRHPL